MLCRLRQGCIVKLHQLIGVQGFNGIGFAVEIDKFDFKDSRFVCFHNGADLSFEQVEFGQVLGEGNDI